MDITPDEKKIIKQEAKRFLALMVALGLITLIVAAILII